MPAPPINLLKGWPSPSLLPTALILSAANSVLSNAATAAPALSYGPDLGYAPLIGAISRWLGASYRNCESMPDNICISGGASQNLSRLLQAYTDPIYTRAIWMISPTYYLACRVFEDAGFKGKLKAVEEGPDGIDIRALVKRISNVDKKAVEEGNTKPNIKPSRPDNKKYSHIIYLVPTFSNPTGKTMPIPQRRELLSLARSTDALLVTDDVYDFLPAYSSPDPALPRLVDLDRLIEGRNEPFGNVVSNGSFSKLAGPGVRCGWADGSPALVRGLSQIGSTKSGGAPSQLVAAFMAQMLDEGALQTHITEILVPAYTRRAGILRKAVEDYLVPLGAVPVNVDRPGGYFLWVKLPEGIKASELSESGKSREDGVLISAGPAFEVLGDELGLEDFIRLCWSYEEENKLGEGVKRIADLINTFNSKI